MSYPCVPLSAAWTGDTKLDLKAIYARPNGDLTTALPLRRHYQWVDKGLRYVTLADHESLQAAARSGLVNASAYVVGLDGDGRQTPWDAQRYLADRVVAEQAETARLAELVATHGAETVEAITGQPVPASLKGKAKAKGAAA